MAKKKRKCRDIESMTDEEFEALTREIAGPCVEWIKERNIDLDNQLIPRDASLDIKDFKDFITKRKALLKERLMTIVQ